MVPPESDDNLHLEIGHVLFIDIVGYSKLLNEEQKERLNQLELRNRAGTLHQRVRRERIIQNFPGGFDSRYRQSCGIQEAELDQD